MTHERTSAQYKNANWSPALLLLLLPAWDKPTFPAYLGSYLAQTGFPWQSVEALFNQLAEQGGTDSLEERIERAKEAFEKGDASGASAGKWGLLALLGRDAWTEFLRLTEPKSLTQVESCVEASGEKPPSTSPNEIEFPEEVWQGVFNDYKTLMEPTTEAPASFHYGTFATIIGALLKRDVYVNYGGELYPNFFTCLVGRTGTEKKDTAINRGRRFLPHDDTLLVEVVGTGSAEGLIQCFMDEATEIEGKRVKTALEPVEGRCVLSTEYEFARFLAKSVQRGSNLLSTYMSLYDAPDEYSPPTRNNRLKAIEPTLSFLTASTLQGCETYLTDEHVGSGFLNRFAFFVGRSDRLIPFPPKPEEMVLKELKAKIEHILKWVNKLNEGGLTVSVKAKKTWSEFYMEWQQKRRATNPLLADMWSRIPNHIWKLAMLYAVTDERQEIASDDLDLAILVGDYLQKTSGMLVGHLAKSKSTKTEEYILNKLRAVHPQALTRRQVHVHVGGRVNVNALERLLDGLIKMQLIAPTLVKGKDGKERNGYVAII